MSEKWFDNIEDMGREASEQYSLPFREESWKKMEALLDKDEKKRFPIWWWLLPALFLVTGGGILFASLKNGSPVEKQAAITKSISTPGKTQPAAGSETTPATTNDNKLVPNQDINKQATPGITSNTDATPATADKARDSLSQNKNRVAANTGAGTIAVRTAPAARFETDGATNNVPGVKQASTKSRKPLQVYAGIAPGAKVFTAKDTQPGSTTNTGLQVGSKAGDKTTDAADGSIFNSSPLGVGNGQLTKDPAVGQSPVAIIEKGNAALVKTADSATAIEKDKTTAINTPTKKDKKTTSKNTGFTFSISGSADLSTVKFKKVDKLSTGYGLGVAYRFGNRWAVGTGIGFSQKRYLADSTNYKKISFMGWYPQVLKIDATCGVIEVPVNIQYMISKGKKANWYATAGLSSYFMKKESYDYTIKSYGVEKHMNYSYQNESNHYLSILNLQLDYEKKLGEKMALRLSPFVKLPLAGIGVGKVSLESVGLQASLQWSPKRKK